MLSTYRLPGMMSGEKVIRIVRRGKFVFFKKLVFMAGLAVIPFGFFGLVLYSYPTLFSDPVYFPLIALGASSYYLFLWLFLFFLFIDYYLNVFAITSERIIDIKQEGFFAREISEQQIEKVQDVTSHVDGVFATLFGYGDILVQTAGNEDEMIFKEISHPDEIRDMIIRLAEEKRGHSPQGL